MRFVLLQRTKKLEENNRKMQQEKEELRREFKILSSFLRHHSCTRNPTTSHGGTWNASLCGEQVPLDPDVPMYVNIEQ